MGALDIGDVGVRVFGLVWLGLSVGSAAAGFGLWQPEPWGVTPDRSMGWRAGWDSNPRPKD